MHGAVLAKNELTSELHRRIYIQAKNGALQDQISKALWLKMRINDQVDLPNCCGCNYCAVETLKVTTDE